MRDGTGLGDAYGVTLERIKAQDEGKAKLAMAALTWVCHSERPLRVDELCYALAVEIGVTDFDSENIPPIGTLLDCCQGLITVDKEASTVRLIHSTVQEYLCAHPNPFSKPHSIIAETCLTYLNSHQVKNLTSHPLPDDHSIPFLEYSSRYWGTHANRELSDHARTLALDLLNRYEDHISAISLLKQVLHPRYIGAISTSLHFSGLHCASFFGIVELAITFINVKDCKINQQDCSGSTPLSWAARNGHEGVAKMLLEQEGVDPNLADVLVRTPLGSAAAGGHEVVVKLLIEWENVDPNHLDVNNVTPLWHAAAIGHEGIVKLMLGRGDVDPNHPNQNGRTPLGCAAVKGHEGVVKLLLERENVDPNHSGENGVTPLWCAAAAGHEGVVKLLLGLENVDPNRPGINDSAPLARAAAIGHEGIVKLLLERGNIDTNRTDKIGLTPLWWAASEGHVGVVKLLLERENVDLNRADKDDITPLWWAANGGYEGMTKRFLEWENDLNRVPGT